MTNFTVTVTAANINSDGVPGNASSLDQDFALVIYNVSTNVAPQIINQPASQTNAVGGSVSLNVAVTGAAPLSYQWFFNNATVPDATNVSLTFASLAATNTGNYFVIITNASGSATSSVATLTVTLAPVIAQSPVSQAVLIGQPAYFTVTAIGQPTLVYQWRKNGGNLDGATATNYSIASVAAGDVGNYDVLVTNFSGSVTSSAAALSVVNPASYGGVLAAWEVTGLSGYGLSPFAATTNAPKVSVVGLTRGSGVGTANTAGANAWGGTGFVYANEAAAIAGNSFATFSLTVSNGFVMSCTNIPVYNIRHSSSGSTAGIWQYQVGAGNFVDIGSAITWGGVTSSAGNLQSAIDLSGIAALQNVPAGTNVTFRIVLWGGTGTGSWYVNNLASGLDLQVLGNLSPVNAATTAPDITAQPVTTNIFVGKNAGFSVSATGTAPLNFQWLKNGIPFADAGAISGARTNVLNFAPAATNHAGSYSVIVTNLGGAVTSSVALLNVAPLPTLVFSNSSGGLVLGAAGGAVSNAYIIQSATNLLPPISWTPLLTNVIGTNGQIRFTETNYNLPASFYRIVIP